MNSFQESKNELEAAIRYAENAISSAQGTIESMEFRQEMAKKNFQEQTGREEALTKLVKDLEMTNETLVIDNHNLEIKVENLIKQVEELKQANMSLVCDNDDLKDEITGLKSEVEVYTKKYNELVQQKDEAEAHVNALEQPERPTMPVIPKDVAIAIFREGVQSGVRDAVAELEGQSINIEETEYCGDFEVSFSRRIDLDDELDIDWMRDKVGQYEESFVVGALKGLCASKEFECRIHGIDDND